MTSVQIISTIHRTKMIIARIYYPVTTLGHGKRVGIWVAGCNKNCKNCMSENLRSFDSGVAMSIDEICKTIEKIEQEFDGFTISGGEPFLQIDELVELTERLSSIYTDDIIIYTGYTLEQLEMDNAVIMKRIKNSVSAIIDGEYIESLNDGVGTRGSSNQNVHIFKNHNKHRKLLTQERKVQIIEHKKGITVIGIP